MLRWMLASLAIAEVSGGRAVALAVRPTRKRFAAGRSSLGVLRGGGIHGGFDTAPDSPLEGACLFQPYGPGGLQDPTEDAIYEACRAMEVGGPEWTVLLHVEYDLDPL